YEPSLDRGRGKKSRQTHGRGKQAATDLQCNNVFPGCFDHPVAPITRIPTQNAFFCTLIPQCLYYILAFNFKIILYIGITTCKRNIRLILYILLFRYLFFNFT
ncbi:hypothetical protein T310_10097, partial [Rasamsonia emersonii CBS 393.64]